MGKTVTLGSGGAHPCRGSCCRNKGALPLRSSSVLWGEVGNVMRTEPAGEGMPGLPEQLLCNVDTHLYTHHRKAPE